MTTTFLERPGAHGPIPGIDYHVALGYYPEAGGTVARWDTARWDTAGAKWVGVAPLDDVTCDVISVDTAEGRDQPLERFRPGTCTVVLNDPDGKYSPWSTAFDPSQYSAIRVGIDLVAWAEIGGTRYPRFRGIVDQITDGFDTDGSHTVTFQALDYLSLLAAYDGVEQPAARRRGTDRGADLPHPGVRRVSVPGPPRPGHHRVAGDDPGAERARHRRIVDRYGTGRGVGRPRRGARVP